MHADEQKKNVNIKCRETDEAEDYSAVLQNTLHNFTYKILNSSSSFSAIAVQLNASTSLRISKFSFFS